MITTLHTSSFGLCRTQDLNTKNTISTKEDPMIMEYETVFLC
ncbi:hypothetical protein [uncultured Winogradskyella sp.]